MTTQSPANYDSIWRTHWGDMQKYGPIHRHQRRILGQLVRDYPCRSVLDLGCGEGSNLLSLLRDFPNIKRAMGVDISSNALDQARALLPGHSFQQLDLETEVLPETFDVVYSSDVIEHVIDDEAFLHGAYQMTDDVFLVGTLQGRMRAFEKSIGHIRNYDHGELRAKCERAGFIVVKEVHWGWPFYSPVYRNLNNMSCCQTTAGGSYGPAKIMLCHVLYTMFHLNSSRRGDIIWLACEKN